MKSKIIASVRLSGSGHEYLCEGFYHMSKKAFFFLLLCIQFVSAQELALVRKNEKFGYISKAGAFVIQPMYKTAKNFSDGLAAFEDQGKWGFINMKGDIVIPATFDEAKYFDSGICVVAKDKRWFYINKKGETISAPPSDKVFDFEDGIAMIKRGDK